MTLLPGTTVGRYQILEPLGQGGMATVYKAFQPSLEREVALKVLRPGFAQDAEFRERFEREAKSIARLRHPNVVQVFDFEVTPSGEFVLAMEFLDGGTLKDRIAGVAAKGRGVDPAEAVRILWEVADALSYAHEQGIVHRDVKPSNVMLARPRDRAVVTDFGIARILGATSHTQTGVGIGTPEYMAPEQGQGGTVDHRADIYSLGAMAYELFTGRVPYTADTPLAVVIAHIKDPLPLPSKVNPTIGQGVERALLKALAKDPAQRYDTALAFAEALTAGLAEDGAGRTVPTMLVRAGASAPPAARPAAAAPKQLRLAIPPPLARRPIATGVGAALVLAMVVGGVVAGNAFRASPQATSAPTTSTSVSLQPAGSVAPTPSVTRGRLVWSAKLNGTLSDLVARSADAQGVTVTPSSGAVEFAVKRDGASTQYQLDMPALRTFRAELDLAFADGATMPVRVIPRIDDDARGLALVVRPSDRTIGFEDGPARASPVVQVQAIAAAFTLVLEVEAERATALLAGQQIAGSLPNVAKGTKLGFQVGDGVKGTGMLRLTGARIYELASAPVAIATSAATATPRPTTSPRPIPAKGALVYEARLDGSAADIRPNSTTNRPGPGTQDTSPGASELRLVPGAIEMVINKPGGGLAFLLNAPSRRNYVLEIDLQATAKSEAIFGFSVRSSSTGAYFVKIQTDLEEGNFFYAGHTSGENEPIAPAFTLEGLLSRAVTLAVVANEDRYELYVDGKKVGEGSNTRIRPATTGSLQCCHMEAANLQGGTMRITGFRLYDLP